MNEYIKIEDAIDLLRTAECDRCDDSDECVFCTVNEMFHIFNIMKPADVEEVRHGEWVQTTEPLGWSDVDCIECSACGESWIMDEELSVDDYKDGWNYCPNCGAKMDGKGKGK